MGNLFAFFGSLAVSLPSRVLASIGIGFISYAGYAAVVDVMVTDFVNMWSTMGADVTAYMSIAGFRTGIGIILGAGVMRLSLTSLASLGKVT